MVATRPAPDASRLPFASHAEADDRRARQAATIATCGLFTVLFLVTFPGGERPVAKAVEVTGTPVLRWHVPRPSPRPPPARSRQSTHAIPSVTFPPVVRERFTAVGDPNPLAPPDAPTDEMPSLPVLDPPRRPPRSEGPVREDVAGLLRPVLVSAPMPGYTPCARRLGVEGNVELRAIVDRTGGVRSVELVRGIGRCDLDEIAVEAVSRRRYRPGLLEGRPVEVLTTIVVRFKLQ